MYNTYIEYRIQYIWVMYILVIVFFMYLFCLLTYFLCKYFITARLTILISDCIIYRCLYILYIEFKALYIFYYIMYPRITPTILMLNICSMSTFSLQFRMLAQPLYFVEDVLECFLQLVYLLHYHPNLMYEFYQH